MLPNRRFKRTRSEYSAWSVTSASAPGDDAAVPCRAACRAAPLCRWKPHVKSCHFCISRASWRRGICDSANDCCSDAIPIGLEPARPNNPTHRAASPAVVRPRILCRRSRHSSAVDTTETGLVVSGPYRYCCNPCMLVSSRILLDGPHSIGPRPCFSMRKLESPQQFICASSSPRNHGSGPDLRGRVERLSDKYASSWPHWRAVAVSFLLTFVRRSAHE